jgi:hypothetical protein
MFTLKMRRNLNSLWIAFLLVGCGDKPMPSPQQDKEETQFSQSGVSVALSLSRPFGAHEGSKGFAFVRSPPGTSPVLRNGGIVKDSPAFRSLLHQVRQKFIRDPACLATNVELVADVVVERAGGYFAHGGGYITIQRISGWRFIDHDEVTGLTEVQEDPQPDLRQC